MVWRLDSMGVPRVDLEPSVAVGEVGEVVSGLWKTDEGDGRLSGMLLSRLI